MLRQNQPALRLVFKSKEGQITFYITQIQENVRKLEETQKTQKGLSNQHHKGTTKYHVGVLVFIQNLSIQTKGKSPKLQGKFKSPFWISEILENGRYKM